MHEYSISSQIWESVSRAAREQGGGRVLSIVLEVGVLVSPYRLALGAGAPQRPRLSPRSSPDTVKASSGPCS